MFGSWSRATRESVVGPSATSTTGSSGNTPRSATAGSTKRTSSTVRAAWWRPAQWLTTAFLWSVWLQQDAANIAVYLPRSLSLVQLAAFCSVIFFGLGILMKMGGEKVQEVVEEKSDVWDVRAARATPEVQQ